MGGCGWVWMDVDGCGWMCVDVGGCGWMWMDVDYGFLQQLQINILKPVPLFKR